MDPVNYVHRGRIAVFSIMVLREERMVIIAEQKNRLVKDFNRRKHKIETKNQVGARLIILHPFFPPTLKD